MKKNKGTSHKNRNLIVAAFERAAKFLIFRLLLFFRYIRFAIMRLKAKDNLLLVNVQGSKMRLDLSDIGISIDLAVDKIREPQSTETIKKIIKKGDVIVDIGANIGYYALMESRLTGSRGFVYAIEPVPENFKNLEYNIRLNHFKNIECHMIGIGDKNGTAKIYLSPNSNLNSLVMQKGKLTTGSIKIKLKTLGRFIRGKKFPNFIRMDVEGYEYEIINGMKNMLNDKKPLTIFIEIHPHIMKREQTIFVLKTLKRCGFEATRISRSFTTTEMAVKSKNEIDYSGRSISSLINDELIISGGKGAFEIFFEKK